MDNEVNKPEVEPKQTEILPEIKAEPQLKLSTPVAIIIAAVLVVGAIFITNGNGGNKVVKEKTLSEQVGVSKEQMASCIKTIDTTALGKGIQTSVEAAMKNLADNQKGTPYSIIASKDGTKNEIFGAKSYEEIIKLIDEVKAGKVTNPYKGELPAVTAEDHIVGDINAPIIIVEYSDYECPYCKALDPTLKKIVSESNGGIAWVFRHWPIHQNSFAKLVAAECVAKINGNDAFWKYSDLLFGLLKTAADPVSNL